MTQNFEQNLVTAIQEVVASIDPNYTFDKERNCYVAHDKERQDSVIMFAYEKPFVDFFGHKNTSVSTSTNIFQETFVLFDKDSVNDMKEVITRQTNYVRSSDKVRQLIEDSFPELQNPKFNDYTFLDQTEMTVYSDNIAPFKVSLTWDEEYTTNPDKVADITVAFLDSDLQNFEPAYTVGLGESQYAEAIYDYPVYHPQKAILLDNVSGLHDPQIKESLTSIFDEYYKSMEPKNHQLLHDFYQEYNKGFSARNMQVQLSPTLLVDPAQEKEEDCFSLETTTLDGQHSVNYYLAKRDNNLELIENDYEYHTARTFNIAEHNGSVPETLSYMLDELSSDLPGMAPRHIRDIEPFLKPDKKASFNRNDYRSPLESDNKDKSGTHITSGLQLFEPDEFFELDKKSDYTELIKNRLPQEEPDNDDDLDLPF